MRYQKKSESEKWGKRFGYTFSYFLFTTILYFILRYTHKIPTEWSYYHVMGITLCIIGLSYGVKRWLE